MYKKCHTPCYAENDTAKLPHLYEVWQIELHNGTVSGIKITRTNDQPLALVIKCP